jgi:pimeloyl-ACP methyl ester carboxylesterase
VRRVTNHGDRAGEGRCLTTLQGTIIRILAVACLTLLGLPAAAVLPAPQRIVLGGIELHYVSVGSGDPVILLHAGQDDYRAWEPQVAELARSYRVIAYSRRYNFPNQNAETSSDLSAVAEAADLAGLIRALRLKRVNLVGTSMGAATALALAMEHPRMIRSLVLAEPPILSWVHDFSDGAMYRDFMSRIHDPARTAFEAADDVGAMRLFVDGFAQTGRFDALPADSRRTILQNAGFFRMLTRSRNPYPDLARQKVRALRMPVLVITGEKTPEMYRRIDEELSRLIPRARSATIPNAGHASARENPGVFTEVVENFLQTSG